MRTHLWSERHNLFVFVAWQSWHHRVKWFRLSAFGIQFTNKSILQYECFTSIVLFIIRSDTRFFDGSMYVRCKNHTFALADVIPKANHVILLNFNGFLIVCECDLIEIQFESLEVPLCWYSLGVFFINLAVWRLACG